MKSIKLSEYAKMKSIVYKTAWNRFIEGKIPNAYEGYMQPKKERR